MDASTEGRPSGHCPWCSATVASGAWHCPACGAAIAQRESIGDLVIPGVTAIDPSLARYAAEPLRIPGPSPSQSMTGRAIVEAALLVADYAGVGAGAGLVPADLDAIGRPGDAAVDEVERLEREASSEAGE